MSVCLSLDVLDCFLGSIVALFGQYNASNDYAYVQRGTIFMHFPNHLKEFSEATLPYRQSVWGTACPPGFRVTGKVLS